MNMEMTAENIKAAITRAVGMLLSEKPSLVEMGAHEQAISHRIALYLEESFRECGDLIKIDCEYNMHADLPKTIDLRGIDSVRFLSCGCAACKKLVESGFAAHRLEEKHFRPDIVVHQRRTDNNNILAIEIKKTKPCPFDGAKLEQLTLARSDGGNYAYRFGVAICFQGRECFYDWFPQ